MSLSPLTLEALRALSEEDAAKLGVSHTLSEILQQPWVWLDTCRRVRASGVAFASPREVPRAELEWVLIGAGSSDFVAQLVAPALRASVGQVTLALPTTDLLTQASALLLPTRRQHFVWFSRSGTTPEALELLPLLEASYPASQHVVITCNAQAELLRLAPGSSHVVLHDAANDRSLAMTSSFTGMALAGLLIALKGTDEEAVVALGRTAERVFQQADRVSELAWRGYSSACFLGSGALKAAAGECALKLTELTSGRVKTRSDSFLGVRHGPLACLDQKSLLVGLLSSSREERAYELELLREVKTKALAGAVLVVAPEPEPELERLADTVVQLEVPAVVSTALRPLLDVVVGQLLALFGSLAHGIRPDAPSSNGAIARVVPAIRGQRSSIEGSAP